MFDKVSKVVTALQQSAEADVKRYQGQELPWDPSVALKPLVPSLRLMKLHMLRTLQVRMLFARLMKLYSIQCQGVSGLWLGLWRSTLAVALPCGCTT